jgi:hypothetical protein
MTWPVHHTSLLFSEATHSAGVLGAVLCQQFQCSRTVPQYGLLRASLLPCTASRCRGQVTKEFAL